jgi:CRP-like cAMP-binding protein
VIHRPKKPFDPYVFLSHPGLGRRIVTLSAKETFFSQGDSADCIFYLQEGRARLVVVSAKGKEVTVSLISAGEFVGEESLAAVAGLRIATASAFTACTALKIVRSEMVKVMHDETAFTNMFVKFLLGRSMKTQADLIDHLFNGSEKRLARVLLIMAEFDQPVTQETLAAMIGTTRSRVSFFMNRFRSLGFIAYDGRIQVHRSLLNVILHDQLPEHRAHKAVTMRSLIAASHPVRAARPVRSGAAK